MPREKSLFFIGVWLILLAYFVGLPTEIKNYLFVATGLLIIFFSYRSSLRDFQDNRKEYQSQEIKNHPKEFVAPSYEEPKKKPAPKKIIKIIKEEIPVKDLPVKEEIKNEEEDLLKKSIEDLPSYQKVEDTSFKIRKARIRRRPKVMREESVSLEKEEVSYTPSPNIYEEEDDVIVISSDGDK
jgi:hypothetical protein